MKTTFKYITKGIAASALCCFLAFGGGLLEAKHNEIYAANTYYKSVQKETVTKGLTYEKSIRVTDAGLLDVHVLDIQLDSPNISISTIKSKTEYSLKEPTSKLVNDNGAVAGVNGDFFGVSGSYSIPMGVEVANGEILSINEHSNASGNENATFFIDNDNNPFISYVRTEVHFLNEGKENLKVSNVNKIFDLAPPSIITTAAMKDTKQLDERLSGIFKIVCYDDKIQYISKKGETVEIPENGYIVAFNEIVANEKLSLFKIGQRVEFYLRPSIDYDKINNAITGAGKILTQGALANDGGYVAGGKNPRTAIGITQDKKRIILMVVDGRTHSVGATQSDMAQLMLEYGAYEAMHLDGGGSSTMAVTKPGQSYATVVNTLSDGAQRRVINALGIFNDAPIGDIKTIIVSPANKNVLKNSSVKINAYGLDEYYHRIELPADGITYSGTPGSGSFLDGYFMPVITGKIQVNVSFNGITGSSTIFSGEAAELIPLKNPLKLYSGASANLSFNAKTKDADTVSVDNDIITFEVIPPDLGIVTDGMFTASKAGSGYIKCSIGNVVSYVSVYSTLSAKTITGFDDSPAIKAIGYPEGATAQTVFSDEHILSVPNAIKLTYNFIESTQTQAAYVVFEPKLAIPKEAHALRLSVYGDESGHWLRGKIIDAGGKEFTIDFAKAINWTGWKDIDVSIPADAKLPISLERIYAASLSQTVESGHTIFFDNLKGMFDANTQTIQTPDPTKFSDYMNNTGNAFSGGYEITFMPSIYFEQNDKIKTYAEDRKKAISGLLKNSTKSIYMANEDLKKEAGKDVKFNSGVYNTELVRDVLLISLNSKKGGFMQSNPSQWSNIKTSIIQSKAPFVIIYTDLSPFGFKQPKEFELFHSLLMEMKESGKTIFVVSDEWIVNKSDVKDGIRYINAGKFYNPDGSANNAFSILRFNINGNNIRYSFEKLSK